MLAKEDTKISGQEKVRCASNEKHCDLCLFEIEAPPIFLRNVLI